MASTDEDAAFIDRLSTDQQIWCRCIYGKIYFPTYSNSSEGNSALARL